MGECHEALETETQRQLQVIVFRRLDVRQTFRSPISISFSLRIAHFAPFPGLGRMEGILDFSQSNYDVNLFENVVYCLHHGTKEEVRHPPPPHHPHTTPHTTHASIPTQTPPGYNLYALFNFFLFLILQDEVSPYWRAKIMSRCVGTDRPPPLGT